MKSTKLIMMAFAAMLMQASACSADDRMIPAEQLPAAAQSFIKKNFPKESIAFAEKDGYVCPTFEAHLSNGTEINFDRNGNWEKVDCTMAPVPANLVPVNIANYVKTNFAGAQIVKIDKERYGFDIELSNDLELKFNKKGMLIAMDD